ncbi:MAG: DNA mismatch repair protein msh6, partial [Paramarteilia canceri]
DKSIDHSDEFKALIETFPSYINKLGKICESFDMSYAKSYGVIIPNEGFLPIYDESLKKIENINSEIIQYLEKQKIALKKSSMSYGQGTSKYHIEINEREAVNLPAYYQLVSQKKGIKRFTTPEIQNYAEQMELAEKTKSETLENSIQIFFQKFLELKPELDKAVKIFAQIDCYFSLAKFSNGDRYRHQSNFEMCFPTFDKLVSSSDGVNQSISIIDSYHPQLFATSANLVSNSIHLNSNSYSGKLLLVLTGPNMGGKSTLMRQLGQLVILAQLGCAIPASSANFNFTFDRVFVRIGASDNLLGQQSTFMVESSETSAILRCATNKSLVLIDELGRGTSTSDGMAIAKSVALDLSERVIMKFYCEKF